MTLETNASESVKTNAELKRAREIAGVDGKSIDDAGMKAKIDEQSRILGSMAPDLKASIEGQRQVNRAIYRNSANAADSKAIASQYIEAHEGRLMVNAAALQFADKLASGGDAFKKEMQDFVNTPEVKAKLDEFQAIQAKADVLKEKLKQTGSLSLAEWKQLAAIHQQSAGLIKGDTNQDLLKALAAQQVLAGVSKADIEADIAKVTQELNRLAVTQIDRINVEKNPAPVTDPGAPAAGGSAPKVTVTPSSSNSSNPFVNYSQADSALKLAQYQAAAKLIAGFKNDRTRLEAENRWFASEATQKLLRDFEKQRSDAISTSNISALISLRDKVETDQTLQRAVALKMIFDSGNGDLAVAQQQINDQIAALQKQVPGSAPTVPVAGGGAADPTNPFAGGAVGVEPVTGQATLPAGGFAAKVNPDGVWGLGLEVDTHRTALFGMDVGGQRDGARIKAFLPQFNRQSVTTNGGSNVMLETGDDKIRRIVLRREDGSTFGDYDIKTSQDFMDAMSALNQENKNLNGRSPVSSAELYVWDTNGFWGRQADEVFVVPVITNVLDRKAD